MILDIKIFKFIFNIIIMSVLIIGSSGFVGSHLKDGLIGEGINVLQSSSSEKNGFIKLDITNKEDFDHIPRDIEVIFNLGAFIPLEDNINNAEKCMNVNSNGILNILEFCRKRDIKLINSSSASVYGTLIKMI